MVRDGVVGGEDRGQNLDLTTKALWKSRKGNAIRNKIEENYVFLKEDI